MKIRIGDKVKFLNDIGGGTVVSIESSKMVNVENEDGFEIPVMVNELVVSNAMQEADLSEEEEDENVAIEEEEDWRYQEELPDLKGFVEINVQEDNLDPEYYMALIPNAPESPIHKGLQLFLVNDSNHTLLFHFSKQDGSYYETIETGTLEPNMRFNLMEMKERDFEKKPTFAFQVIPFRKRNQELPPFLHREIAIDPVKLHKKGAFVSNEFFTKDAHLIRLNEAPTNEVEEALENISIKEVKKAIREQGDLKRPKHMMGAIVSQNLDLKEVDLHIDALLDNTNGLSKSEMLRHQIEAFNKEMESAIKDKIKRIIFIHGKGNGTLKTQLYKEHRKRYIKYKIQDASFQKYGYGASLIILRK
ncbi:DUF2027 domain-containing protein [Halosquirtibacter laminarini]|uniref:DUF2027 domain-containing protein n=1 Tax=Halosquirtibacter laminarini TaxID=3374600 RepID=A0AC61NHB0_9BACT|nr:DUF2027 domain-containing protein [Prolixibacteraceae bacterium]